MGKPSKPWPRWLPEPESLWQGFYALVVIILATLIGFILVFPHSLKSDQSDLIGFYENTIETEAAWLAAIFFVSVIYLYQAEGLIRRHFRLKQSRRSQLATNRKPTRS